MITVKRPSVYKVTRIFIFMLALGLSIMSCSKDDEPDDPPPTTPSEEPNDNTALQFDNGHGFCAAVISTTTYVDPTSGFSFDIEFGTAVAAFTDDQWVTFNDVGTVSCQSEMLDKMANESYVHTYTYDPLNPSNLGLEFSSNPSWDVQGGNGIPAFTYTTSIGFPGVGTLSGNEIVDRSSNYTMTLDAVSGADSIIYQVGSALVTVAGNATSYTFTPDQLSDTQAGASFAQVAAYKIEETAQGTKVIHFINERVKSYSVTIE